MCDSWEVVKTVKPNTDQRVWLAIDEGRVSVIPWNIDFLTKHMQLFQGDYVLIPERLRQAGGLIDKSQVSIFRTEDEAVMKSRLLALQGVDTDIFRIAGKVGKRLYAVHLFTVSTEDYVSMLELEPDEYERVLKAKDPMTPEGMVTYVKRVIRAWEKLIGEQVDIETEIWLTHLMKSYDWTALAPDEITRILETSVYIPPTVTNPEVTKALIEDTVKNLGGMITAIKEGLSSAGGVFSNIDTALTQADIGALEFVARNGINYFPESFAKSSNRSANVLLREVFKALEQGEHYQEAVDRALEKVGGVVTEQRRRWWDIAAHQLTHRARERGRLEIMHNYAVEVVKVWAVLDEHTTPICEFLHGQVVQVTPLYQRWQEIEANNMPVDQGFPWVQIRKKGEELRLVASGVTFARGTAGNLQWVKGMDMNKVLQYGVGLPPYHPLCRSTAIYDIEYM